jgi:hypothetical protein
MSVAMVSCHASPLAGVRGGDTGADRARSRYSWARVARDTRRVYAKVLAEAGANGHPEVTR